jgi:hypothetical protein
MALFNRHRASKVAPQDAVVIAHRFVSKCREWALNQEIPQRSQRLAAQSDREQAEKLVAWLRYVEFLDHTLAELEDGRLDPWFLADEAQDGGPADERG